MLSVSQLDHMLYVQPGCELNVIFAQGCSGCAQATPIIFQAMNIRNTGVLHFESDCEFEAYTVACSPPPSAVHLYGNPPICHLYFPEINKTIIVKPDYIFLGNLTSADVWFTQTDANIGDSLKMLFSNSNFLTGLISSFTLGSVGLLIINLVMRLLALLAGRKIGKEMSN